MARLRLDKEAERDRLKTQLATRPIEVSASAIRRLEGFYEALFADQSFAARRHAVQSFVLGVRIDAHLAHLTYHPGLTEERDRVPLDDRNDDGGPDRSDSGPPPKVRTAQKWLPGQDSNLRPGGYRVPLRFRKAWTISSPYRPGTSH